MEKTSAAGEERVRFLEHNKAIIVSSSVSYRDLGCPQARQVFACLLFSSGWWCCCRCFSKMPSVMLSMESCVRGVDRAGAGGLTIAGPIVTTGTVDVSLPSVKESHSCWGSGSFSWLVCKDKQGVKELTGDSHSRICAAWLGGAASCWDLWQTDGGGAVCVCECKMGGEGREG